MDKNHNINLCSEELSKMEDNENDTTNLPKVKVKIEHRTDVAKWTTHDIEVTGKTSVEALGTFKEVLKMIK